MPSGVQVKKIAVSERDCKECRICQLICSFTCGDAFNLAKAEIAVEKGSISFSSTCLGKRGQCTLCARYCPFGALRIQ